MGGTGVFCSGKDPVTLDYYQAMLPKVDGSRQDLVNVEALGYDGINNLIHERLRAFGFSQTLATVETTLGKIATWTATDLSHLNDSGAPYPMPAGCVEQQLAVQVDGQVFADPIYINQLNSGQRALLEFHEYFYRIAIQNGWTKSIPVRELMLGLLKKKTDLLALYPAVSKFLGSSAVVDPNINGTELQGYVILRWKISTAPGQFGKGSSQRCDYGWEERFLLSNQVLRSGTDLVQYEYKLSDSGQEVYVEKKIPVYGKGKHKFMIDVACGAPGLGMTGKGITLHSSDVRTEGNVIFSTFQTDEQVVGGSLYDKLMFYAISN